MLIVCLDIEGSKKPILNPWQIGSFLSTIGVVTNEGDRHHWVFAHEENKEYNQQQNLKEIQAWLDKADLLVAHNAKFDVNWLRWLGLTIPNNKIFCTNVAEYMLRGQKSGIGYRLNDCAKRYGLPTKHDKVAEYWDAGINTDKIPLDILVPYMMQDIDITLALYEKQVEMIAAKKMVTLTNYCFEVTGILSEAEVAGFEFDKEKAEELVVELTADVEHANSRLSELVGFPLTVTAPEKLSAALFGGTIKEKYREQTERVLKSGKIKYGERWAERLVKVDGVGFKPEEDWESDKKPGVFSTSADVIKTLRGRTPEQKEFVEILRSAKKDAKVLSTFTSKSKDSSALLHVIGKDGRVHPSFNQTVTVTGRLSSSKPNGQNLPRKGTSPIKKTIYSRNGRIVNVDLGQIEWRMSGELSGDAKIIEEVCKGIDAHLDNALKFFGSADYRTVAKIVTFGLIYGRTAVGFFRDGKMPDFSMNKWKKIITQFFQKYFGLKAWQEKNYAEVLKVGYLQNFTGRILTFKAAQKYDGSYGPSEKAVSNYPIQSISADLIYIAMVEITRRMRALGLKSEFIIQVHDSMVFDAFIDEIDLISKIAIDVFEELPEMCYEMFGRSFSVPLTGDVEVGLTYGDIVGYNIYMDEGKKYLYSFEYEKEDEIKTDQMWVLSEEDILDKHPTARSLKQLDMIEPRGV